VWRTVTQGNPSRGETCRRWRADVLVRHHGLGARLVTGGIPTTRTGTSALQLKFQVSAATGHAGSFSSETGS
jgi:hypothetical protein